MSCDKCWLKYSSYCPICRGEYWCERWEQERDPDENEYEQEIRDLRKGEE